MGTRALLLIALAVGTGSLWAQFPSDSLVAVSRNRELNDAVHIVALDSLTAQTLRTLNSAPDSKSAALPSNALRAESPDGSFAFVTLNAPLSDGSYAYRGLIGRPLSKRQWKWESLDEARWPEAIIYKVVLHRYRKRNYYLLLWFQPHLNGVQAKGIEPVIVSRTRATFGARVFAVKKFNDETFRKPPERLVLRYGPMATAAVRMEKPGVLSIDDVAPVRDAPKGDYRYYGPTAVQNRLVFRDGKWRFETLP